MWTIAWGIIGAGVIVLGGLLVIGLLGLVLMFPFIVAARVLEVLDKQRDRREAREWKRHEARLKTPEGRRRAEEIRRFTAGL